MKLRAIAKERAPIESSTKMHEPKEVTAKEIKLLGQELTMKSSVAHKDHKTRTCAEKIENMSKHSIFKETTCDNDENKEEMGHEIGKNVDVKKSSNKV